MNKKEMIKLIEKRIKSCYRDLLYAKSIRSHRRSYIEGFRCRLDELILLYQIIENISFIDACKKLKVKYEDVDTQSHPSMFEVKKE